jgi:hypothetical protein
MAWKLLKHHLKIKLPFSARNGNFLSMLGIEGAILANQSPQGVKNG